MPNRHREPPDSRLLAFLRRVNSQFGPVVRWTGLAGIVAGTLLGEPTVVSTFAGLFAMSLAIGRDGTIK